MNQTAKQTKQVIDFQKHLDRHDELLLRSKAKMEQYGKGIEKLPFQDTIVEAALKAAVGPEKWFRFEGATGIGKSVIAARVCVEQLSKGPCLVVCPSSAALGDEGSGIINKFVRTFEDAGLTPQFGELNDVSLAHDVSFVTPGSFVNLLKNQGPRIKKYLATISTMVVDEAHHFPEDEDEHLVIYGEIERVAKKYVKGLVFALTGTWTRLDGKAVMGAPLPDARITVQDAVDLGRAPPLYAIEVITEVTSKHARASGEFFDFKLTGPAQKKYWQGIADCVHITYKKYPSPFAVFARTRQDAAEIVKRFNRLSTKKMVVMDSGTPLAQRKGYVEKLNAGTLAGYATCAVGEEAIDIPQLEVVHLVRRTKSITRNMQAIGRALRVSPSKKRALVVDYQTMVEGLKNRFVGLGIEDLVAPLGTRSKRKLVHGGPIIEQDNYDDCGVTNIELSMAEERAILCKRKLTQTDRIKAFLLEYAAKGNPRPTKSMKGWVEI